VTVKEVQVSTDMMVKYASASLSNAGGKGLCKTGTAGKAKKSLKIK